MQPACGRWHVVILKVGCRTFQSRPPDIQRLERSPEARTRLKGARASTDVSPVGLTGSLRSTRTTAQAVPNFRKAHGGGNGTTATSGGCALPNVSDRPTPHRTIP